MKELPVVLERVGGRREIACLACQVSIARGIERDAKDARRSIAGGGNVGGVREIKNGG
jgi:hypothetical protein